MSEPSEARRGLRSRTPSVKGAAEQARREARAPRRDGPKPATSKGLRKHQQHKHGNQYTAAKAKREALAAGLQHARQQKATKAEAAAVVSIAQENGLQPEQLLKLLQDPTALDWLKRLASCKVEQDSAAKGANEELGSLGAPQVLPGQ